MKSLVQEKAPPPPLLQPHESGVGCGGMEGNVSGNGGFYVKVMTDEQLEILRTQIAVYVTLSEQLVQMHNSITSNQHLSGASLGNLYCDPMGTISQKFTARQRWTPSPVQLQILERIFEQGTGTPSKQKIKEMTAELAQHGQISETNVYNWFQNRRARSKRKQSKNAQNPAESEVEVDVDSPKDRVITKPEFQSQNDSVPRDEDLCYQNQEIGSFGMDPQSGKMEHLLAPDDNSKSSECLSQLAFYESILQNSNVIGKMEVPENYFHYPPSEDFSLTG